MTRATGLTEQPAAARRSGSASPAGKLSTRYEGPLTGLTSRTHDAVTLSDAASQRFLEVNDSFCALTGYSREELLGRTAPEVGLIGENPLREAAIASVERGIGVVHEPEIRRKDGTLRELEVSTLVFDDNKVVLTISRDITDRKQAQRELAAREARFRAAVESTRDGLAFISPVRDEQGAIIDFRYDYANDAHRELVARDREQLLGRRFDELFPGWSQSPRFEIYRQVALSGEPCRTEDFHPDPGWGTLFAGRVIDNLVACAGGQLVVSARDVTDRRRVEVALRASEERFQTAIGAMLDAFVIFSPVRDDHGEIVDFRYAYVNAAYCALVDRDDELLLGHTIGELFPGYLESDRFALYQQVAVTGEPATSQDVTGTDDWTRSALGGRVIDTVVAPMGESLVMYGRDVTDRWNAQQAHAAAEARLRDVIESAPDAMVIVNTSGEIVLVNAQTETLLGYTREELIGQNHELLVPEPLRERHRAHRAHYSADSRARPMGDGLELFARRKDGSMIPVEASLSPLGDENMTLICSTIRDVSARRQAEAELRASRERLAEAERVAGLGSWEGDLATGRVTYSGALLALYGLSVGQFDGTVEAARELVYPDDRDHFHTLFKQAVDERSAFDIEHRVIRRDGRVRTLRSRGDIVVDDTGRPVRAIGIVQDITDAKLTQEALQSTSAELGRRANELQQLALRSANEPPDVPYALLSARQLEIMQLVAQGLTNAEIGKRLHVTEGTIKWHVRQVLSKTNSSNRAEAIARVLGGAP
jgi:PAS domain S-box-containing protein